MFSMRRFLVLVGIVVFLAFGIHARNEHYFGWGLNSAPEQVAKSDTKTKGDKEIPKPPAAVAPNGDLAKEIVEGLKPVFADIHALIEKIDARVGKVEEKVGKVEERVNALESRPATEVKLDVQGLGEAIAKNLQPLLQPQQPPTPTPVPAPPPPQAEKDKLPPKIQDKVSSVSGAEQAAGDGDICQTRKLPVGFTERDAKKFGVSRERYLEQLLAKCDAPPADNRKVVAQGGRIKLAGDVPAAVEDDSQDREEAPPEQGRRESGRCSKHPGFDFNPENGTCERTVALAGGFPKYDKPHSNCKVGDPLPDVVVNLPGGGTRTLHRECKFDRDMR